MGAWGIGTFENDDAMDWVHGLEQAADHSLLEEAFDEVLRDTSFIEEPLGSNALAAAEIVAALSGRMEKKLPDEVIKWMKYVPPPNRELIEKARKVVFAIQSPASELWELWADADSKNLEAWKQSVLSIVDRLK